MVQGWSSKAENSAEIVDDQWPSHNIVQNLIFINIFWKTQRLNNGINLCRGVKLFVDTSFTLHSFEVVRQSVQAFGQHIQSLLLILQISFKSLGWDRINWRFRLQLFDQIRTVFKKLMELVTNNLDALDIFLAEIWDTFFDSAYR
jgi:hypothetical protein